MIEEQLAVEEAALPKGRGANPKTKWDTLKKIVMEKRQHLDEGLAFDEEEQQGWCEKIDDARAFTAERWVVKPGAQLKTVIQLATTRHGGVFTPLLYVDGCMPTLAGYGYGQLEHKIAGVVTMRRSDHWLLFLLATMLYKTGGRGWGEEDARLLGTLPPTLEELEGVKVLGQLARFLHFTRDNCPAEITLMEGLGYRIFMWDAQNGELVQNSLVEREHFFGAWPALPKNQCEFEDQAVDVAKKYRASFNDRYCIDDKEKEARELWTSLAGGGGAASAAAEETPDLAKVVELLFCCEK